MSLDVSILTRNPVMLFSALLFAAASGLLLTSIVLLLAAIFYSPDAPVFKESQQVVAAAVDTRQISNRYFFGEPAAEPDISEVTLPETELALVLRGAFAQSNAEDAGAIIEDENTRIANHYVVGEEVTEDATLKAVYEDRVVLARNGKFETLYFPELASASGIGTNKLRSAAGTPGTSPINLSTDEAKKRRDAIRERIKQLRKR